MFAPWSLQEFQDIVHVSRTSHNFYEKGYCILISIRLLLILHSLFAQIRGDPSYFFMWWNPNACME